MRSHGFGKLIGFYDDNHISIEGDTETAVSEDVVKTRLHRARAMLRDNLYRRAGVTLDSLFAFGNTRCDRVVAAVMVRTAESVVELIV